LVTEYSLIDLHQLKILLLAKLIAFCIAYNHVMLFGFQRPKTNQESGIYRWPLWVSRKISEKYQLKIRNKSLEEESHEASRRTSKINFVANIPGDNVNMTL
jgi:hypothetical protein